MGDGDAGGLSCRPARCLQAGCGLGYGLGSSCGGHKVGGSVIWCRGEIGIELVGQSTQRVKLSSYWKQSFRT